MDDKASASGVITADESAIACLDSIGIVSSVFDETVLQNVADHFYNLYLQPKIVPYTMKDTIELSSKQVSANFLEHDHGEVSLAEKRPDMHVWDDYEEPSAGRKDTHDTE